LLEKRQAQDRSGSPIFDVRILAEGPLAGGIWHDHRLSGPQHVTEHAVGDLTRRERDARLPDREPVLVRTRLRVDAKAVADGKKQQPPVRTRMVHHDTHQTFDELA
jgi:hypothetical protein